MRSILFAYFFLLPVYYGNQRFHLKNNNKKGAFVLFTCVIFSGCPLAIVEETLTSDEYISVILISILKIYILNLNDYVPISVILKEQRTNWQPEKITQVKRTNVTFLLLFFK